jgi:predicted Zn-dependent protease
MSNVFATLDRVSASSGGGKLPDWLSTHPNPGTRIENTQARLDTLHKDLSNAIIGRDQYLQHVRNMTFGEDPRQGFFEGSAFYHPDLRFQLTFPQGWKTQNGAEAVVAQSPQQDAIIQLGLAGQTPPQQAAQQFLSQQGIQAGNTSTASVNGLPAASGYFQAETKEGTVAGLVTFLSYNGNTYGLLGYTPAAKMSQYDQAFRQTINSFSQLRNQAAMNVQPARVELIKLTREMTLEQFNSQYPSTIPVDQLAIINEVESPSSVIPVGRTVKRVVGGRPGAGTGAAG